MKTLVFFDFLTRFYVILSAIPVKFGQSFRYPGKTSCSYYGSMDKCEEKKVPIEKLPAECSSFFYDGISIDDANNIFGSISEDDEEFMSYLVTQDKPFFLYYGHFTLNGWGNVFNQKGKINKEVAAIRDFIRYFPTSGLVLKDLNIDSTWILPEYLSTSLKVYVEVIKKNIPNLLVGLSIKATVFQKFGICSSSTKNTCFDFKILNTVFDFFSISFEDFNKCDESHIRGGIVPLDGMPGNTLAKFKDNLRDSGIDKNKILFKFSLSPKLSHYSGTPFPCTATMTILCNGRNREPYNVWCADNSATFHEKGIYAKENGAGFIAEYIDMNDPDGKCKCKWPYPSFYYLLNGFTGTGVWTSCPFFDRK